MLKLSHPGAPRAEVFKGEMVERGPPTVLWVDWAQLGDSHSQCNWHCWSSCRLPGISHSLAASPPSWLGSFHGKVIPQQLYFIYGCSELQETQVECTRFHSSTLEVPELLARQVPRPAWIQGRRIHLLRGAATCLFREGRRPVDLSAVFHSWCGADHTGQGFF